MMNHRPRRHAHPGASLAAAILILTAAALAVVLASCSAPACAAPKPVVKQQPTAKYRTAKPGKRQVPSPGLTSHAPLIVCEEQGSSW